MMWEKAYVINLDDRTDRWTWMQDQLGAAGIEAERFPAVSVTDLADLPVPDALREFLLRVDGEGPGFERKINGTWACMHSHLAIIRKAREQELKSVLILEDDCHFEVYTRAVLRRLERQLEGLPSDIFYLGGTVKRGSRHERLTKNIRAVSRVRLAHAYVVSSSIYKKILEEAPVSGLPIDWYYSEKLLPSVSAGMVSPRLAYQRFDDVSSIEGVKRYRKFRSRLFLQRLYSSIRYYAG